MYDVIVIGGGAAGMMAAIAAAREKASVLILEHMELCGKKILSTGNGRCNYTNKMQGIEYYRGDDPAFVLPALEQFGCEQTIRFFQSIGIEPKEKNGYVYPRSMQAASVREALLLELRRQRVKIELGCGIRQILPKKGSYEICTKNGNFHAKTCILATGGKGAKHTGSDGSGFLYLEPLSHHVIDLVPALTGLQAKPPFPKNLAGIRAEVSIRLYINGAETTRERGELQLTDYGISGIPVFQFSRIAARALSEQRQCQVKIDFLPFFQQGDMEKIKESISKVAYKTVEEFLSGMAHKKIASLICKQAQIKPDVRVGELPAKKVMSCVEALRKFTVTVKAANPFENAQVCSGGIPLKEVTDQLESIYCKNIYITGEILDCDGICGGYNLQWAWATGVLAGRATVQ